MIFDESVSQKRERARVARVEEGVVAAKVQHQLTRPASTSCRPPPTSALGCSARTWWPAGG